MRRVDAWKHRALALLILVVLVSISPVVSVDRNLFRREGPAPAPAPASTALLIVNWTLPQRFTFTQDSDFAPDLIQTSDGKVWVFWEVAPRATPWFEDIVYQTYNWSSWSPVQKLVADPAQDVDPSAAQLKNGTLFVSWASNRTGNFDIFLKRYNPGSGWSPDLQITQNRADEVVSSLLAASDGSLWVFWDRQNATSMNIFYKVYRGGAWSPEAPLTTDSLPVRNQQPVALQMGDGRIWVAWSQVQDQHYSKVHILYKTFNGAAWSASTPVTSSNPDTHPSLAQSADGTIWLMWARDLSCGVNCIQQDLFYIRSADNGVTWSSETNITNDVSCVAPNCPDDTEPSLVQLKDGRVWVFWSSTRDPETYWDLYYATTNQLPYHNVAVMKLGASPQSLRCGGVVSINVTVANQGSFPETFQLNLSAYSITVINIWTQTVSLSPGLSTTLPLFWSTSKSLPLRYTITAYVSPVMGENFLGDNTLQGSVSLYLPGDVNLDGVVNFIDLSRVGLGFGTVAGQPGFDPGADLNRDGVINFADLGIIGANFLTAC